MPSKITKDIFGVIQSLPPKDQKEIKAALLELKNCDINGHSYKIIGTVYRWFRPPATKMICTRCGEEKFT